MCFSVSPLQHVAPVKGGGSRYAGAAKQTGEKYSTTSKSIEKRYWNGNMMKSSISNVLIGNSASILHPEAGMVHPGASPTQTLTATEGEDASKQLSKSFKRNPLENSSWTKWQQVEDWEQ